MTLAEAKRIALVLMREWTNNGVIKADILNADYIRSMDDLANLAQNQIASKRRIHARIVLDLNDAEDYGDVWLHTVPANYVETVQIVYNKDIATDYNWLYRWMTSKNLATLKTATDAWELFYYKHPTQIVLDPADYNENNAHIFEIDNDVVDLIPFYIGARLLMDEDIGRATQKLNEFYARLEELNTPTWNTKKIINRTGW